MKIHLKFNHDSRSMLESLDCPLTQEQAEQDIHECLNIFISDDSLTSPSELAEIIHHKLDYSVILYLALLGIKEKIDRETTKSILKKLLDNEDI